jgi:LCP family protein required for cell wall assembly
MDSMVKPIKPAVLPKKKMKLHWKILIIVLAVFLLVGAAFLGYTLSKTSKIFENGLSGTSLLKTIYSREKLKGEENDRVNILIIGMGGPNHPGGLLADSIELISIQPSTKKAVAMSVPRDLKVPIKNYGEDKVNTAFVDGYQEYMQKSCKSKNQQACVSDAMSAGARKEVETISTVFNQPIHYYLTLNFGGFEKFIDAIGGVDVNVAKAIYDPYFPADDMLHYAPFKLKAGLQHLDGKTALKYARSRETSSDFDRSARQQNLLRAVKDKMTAANLLSDPKRILDILNALGDSVKTDFTPSEIKTLAEIVSGIKTADIKTKVLDTSADGPLKDMSDGSYYITPRAGNFKELQKIAQEIFELPEAKAKIELLNGTKTAGLTSKIKLQIEDAGYGISYFGNAKEKTAKTIIYDNSDGLKPKALAYLKKYFKTENVIKKTVDGYDFSIVVGDDFVYTEAPKL